MLRLFWEEKLPHAILLVGRADPDKLSVCSALAQLLLCQFPQNDGACGKCSACCFQQQQSHPDFRCLGESDQIIHIDDIRDTTQFLESPAHQQKNKVLTIMKADKLSLAVSNALLKPLEEPSAGTYIILTAEKIKAIIPTLKSRCFVLNFPDNRLQNFTMNSLSHTLRMALCSKAGDDIYREDVQQLITSQPEEALYLLYYWLADCIRYMLRCPAGYFFNQTEIRKCEEMLNNLSPQQVFKFMDEVNEAIEAISLPSVNKQLLFESLFCQWQQIRISEK